jgi:hypothetical protein
VGEKYGEPQLAGLKRIDHPYVLLCEGAHDAEFFEALIGTRGLPQFTISGCGHAVGARREGIDSLTDALDELPVISGFTNVRAVLIVADNDSDPNAAFRKVCKLIDATAEIEPGVRYSAPLKPLTKAGTKPSVVVMMLPWTDVRGALDSLCYMSAAAKRKDIAACVDAFAKCTKTDIWPVTKLAKMKLRSLISAARIADPYMSPAWVWSEKTDLVPIDDPAFNDIEKFLREFPTLVG